MHLVVFVEPDDVSRAAELCAASGARVMQGAVVCGHYGRAWAQVPRWARIGLSELDAAGIRNFALPNIGGEQLAERFNG